MRSTPFVRFCCWAMVTVACAAPAVAQQKKKPFRLPDRFGLSGQTGGLTDVVAPQVTGELKPGKVQPGQTVEVLIHVVLPFGAHIAPQKSESSFGLPTTFRSIETAGLKAVDQLFVATSRPKSEIDPESGEKQVFFEGKVTWKRKYKVVDATKRKAVSLKGKIRLQTCTAGLCKPPKSHSFVATADVSKSDTGKATPKTAGKKTNAIYPFSSEVTPVHRGEDDPVHLQFELSPKTAKPGETVTASITATFKKGWHAFALTHSKEERIGLPVEIAVQKVQGLATVGKGWRPDKAPKSHRDNKGLEILEHEGVVTWSRQFVVAPDVKPGEYGIKVRLKHQICLGTKCLFPKRTTISLGHLTDAVDAPKGSNDIDTSPFTRDEIGEAKQLDSANLGWYLLLAFAGGLILNVMPCVLPVIAIKVMSFVQQAGEDRRRVFVLNVVYAAGVISVFLLLATLAVTLNFGWGGLFQRAEFTLIMGVVVFAMGLSLLGIYEIPLPGFLGSAAGKQQSEGPAGAFLTGVFATLLATPCSGPFLGLTLAWSVRQPSEVTFLVWGVMGFGMAFPYLLFAVTPKAVKLLPKPGNWMVRFKEISGFVLMGTTVWILQSLQKPELVFAMILISACGFSLWMVGRLYTPLSPPAVKWTIRTAALAMVVFACFAGSHMLNPAHGPNASKLFAFLQRFDLLAAATVFLGIGVAIIPFRGALNDALPAGRRRMLNSLAVVLVLLSAGGAYFVQTFAELPWENYSEQTRDEAIKEGNIVLIDFTADW